MYQWIPSLQWRDRSGQVWDIYLRELAGRMQWRAQRGPAPGRGSATVMTSGEDGKQLPSAVLETYASTQSFRTAEWVRCCSVKSSKRAGNGGT